MNVTTAAKILDRIRNDRTTRLESLVAEVDQVGKWAAVQKTSKAIMQILSESHDLRIRLDSGFGNQFRQA